MTASLVLHVGAMKTGTTYVQEQLAASSERLAAAGWWVPPQRRVVRAVRELLAHASGTASASPRWTRLLDDARAHGAAGGRGTVVSMEFLSHARRHWMPTLAAGLGGLDVRVVLTARDASRAVPAQWQSLVRNGYSLPWPDFAAGVSVSADRPRAPGAWSFRRTQDLPRMLEAWGAVAGPDRFTVVTVPGEGAPRHLLWDRVLTAAGIDPAVATPETSAFDNPQLGYGSCEALRRVNAIGLGQEPPPVYRRVVRRLAQHHLFALRGQETRPRPDRALAVFAAAQNRRTLEAVERHARLVGDPRDLPVVVRDDVAGERPADPPEDDVRRATRALHTGALALCAEQGLVLPSSWWRPLPDDPDAAALRTASVMGVAMTGDVAHRPSRSSATGG